MPPTGLPPSIVQSIQDVVASLEGFSVDGYYFIKDGIEVASDVVHGKSRSSADGSRHVSGRQLCETLRELAIQRWGMMASTVLRSWGIHCTRDFGKLVFAFVDTGHWQKQPQDSIDDFNDVYSFREAFDAQYKIKLSEKAK